MSEINAFAPGNGTNQAISGSTTSSSVTVDRGAKYARIVNLGSNLVFVRCGYGAQTATAADTPVHGNTSLVIYKGEDADTVAAITAASTCTIYVQTGEGGG